MDATTLQKKVHRITSRNENTMIISIRKESKAL